MATIKIPSSHIFDYSKPNKFGKKIQGISASFNSIKQVEGNIIDDNYVINFYERANNPDDNTKYIYNYVGDTKENPFKFNKAIIADNVYYSVPLEDTWRIPIKKEIIPSTLVITLIVKDVWAIGTNIQESFTDETTQRYDYNNFEYDPETYSLIWKVPSNIGTDQDPLNFYVRTYDRYLISRSISFIGTYYETYSQDFNYGTTSNEITVFTLPNNELTNMSNSDISLGLDYPISISQKVIDKYKNGKEVYTIKCSISEYYNCDGYFEGLIAISPYNLNFPAIFKKYDIVEPYLFTNDGEVPLSCKTDGTAKKFEIIGVDFSYDGVPFQELTIQEYVE